MKVRNVFLLTVLLTASIAMSQQAVVTKITAQSKSLCHIDPNGSAEERAVHFAFGLVETGRLTALRQPLKNRGGAVCIPGAVTIEPLPAPEITTSLPINIQPGSYADLTVMYEAEVAGSVEYSLTVDFHTARLMSLIKGDGATYVVDVSVPSGSIVSSWGTNHYVAEESSMTYEWRQGYTQPYPVFQYWAITGLGDYTQSTDNPITVTAGVDDVTVTPVVIEPIP